MALSIGKARQYGFFGTVDSYHSIFNTFHELGRLKLLIPPKMDCYEELNEDNRLGWNNLGWLDDNIERVKVSLRKMRNLAMYEARSVAVK